MLQVVTSTDARKLLLANCPNSIPSGASMYYQLVLQNEQDKKQKSKDTVCKRQS